MVKITLEELVKISWISYHRPDLGKKAQVYLLSVLSKSMCIKDQECRAHGKDILGRDTSESKNQK